MWRGGAAARDGMSLGVKLWWELLEISFSAGNMIGIFRLALARDLLAQGGRSMMATGSGLSNRYSQAAALQGFS